MYCEKCGAKLSDNENFCQVCGDQIKISLADAINMPLQSDMPKGKDKKGKKAKRSFHISLMLIMILLWFAFMLLMLGGLFDISFKNSHITTVSLIGNAERHGSYAAAVDDAADIFVAGEIVFMIGVVVCCYKNMFGWVAIIEFFNVIVWLCIAASILIYKFVAEANVHFEKSYDISPTVIYKTILVCSVLIGTIALAKMIKTNITARRKEQPICQKS